MDDDVDDWQSCNLSKLKYEQEVAELLNLQNECQKWIETITGKQFQYENDFRKSLENGIMLCELLNNLKRNCIKRINRLHVPMAGFDNVNVFLRACQQHFQISQAHLFDSTDLEDLSIRAIDSNASETIDEQNRRLKKVVHTIYWLSRKTYELGIQVPFYLDNTHQLSAIKEPVEICIPLSTPSLSSSASSSSSSITKVTNSLTKSHHHHQLPAKSNSYFNTIYSSTSSDHSSETSGYTSSTGLVSTLTALATDKQASHLSRDSSFDSLNLLSFQSTLNFNLSSSGNHKATKATADSHHMSFMAAYQTKKHAAGLDRRVQQQSAPQYRHEHAQ